MFEKVGKKFCARFCKCPPVPPTPPPPPSPPPPPLGVENIKIAVMNQSTVQTDAQVQAIMAACQIQVSRDFAPAWGIDATLVFVPKGTNPPAGYWWLTVLDDADQAGELGVHDITPEGLPVGKVFAKTAIADGASVSGTFSHELCEMLADPDINLTVFVQSSATAGVLYAYEVCDPCEDDQFGYLIGGVLVSDFVFPSYFEDFRTAGTKFDQTGNLKAPLTLLPGGYMSLFNVTAGSGWQQQTAKVAGRTSKDPTKRSRFSRRLKARTDWRISKLK